ncbi:hypothetical protein [Butyricicoccus sp.]|uniref:hypothetical protein n=1 Tax=Butyricicoccus sp. TaxID=2049021 RepID=UPI003F169FAA
MKKRNVIAFGMAGVCALGFCQTGAFAADNAAYQKNENVYTKLSAKGAVSDAYVVNAFELEKDAEITDYGTYSDIKNLTDLNGISQSAGKITFSANKGKFYYQGTMDDVELPWTFSVKYQLDGKNIEPEELGGKSGHVKITFSIAQNEKVDEVFFENYVSQVSLTLDGDKCSNVKTEDGTIADSGSDKMITYTILPGTEGDYTAEADVKDFAMDGFSIAAVPYSMDVDMDGFDTGDLTGQFSELTDAAKQLSDAAAQLTEGMEQLDSGGSSLLGGYGQIADGLATLNKNAPALTKGSTQILSALKTLNTQLSKADFSDIDKLSGSLEQLSGALTQVKSSLAELGQGCSQAYQALDAAMQSASTEAPTEEELAALKAAAESDSEAMSAYEKLNARSQQLSAIKQTYQQVKPALQAVCSRLNADGENSLVGGLDSVISGLNQMSNALDQTDISGQMSQLQGGISQLADSYQEFHSGLVSYTKGVSSLADGSKKYQSGLSSYLAGVGEAADGTGEFSDGMQEFSDGVAEIPDQMQSKIDEMMEQYSSSDFDAVSFVDERNTDIDSVQFILTTEGIEEPEEEVEEETEEAGGFFQRLLDLFR